MILAAAPIFDEAHLRHFTDGDGALMAEVLRLFLAQEEEYFSRLDGGDASDWHEGIHRLKGAARAIGARRLAAAAALSEEGRPGAGLDRLRDEFAALRDALEALLAGE